MPELPEVETMVRDLTPRVVGRRIASVEAPFPGAVVWPAFDEFTRRVTGQEIVDIMRRGKYASFLLDSGDALIIHRGMTGSLLLRRAGDPLEQYVRLLLFLDDNHQLRLNDARKFGKVFVMDAAGKERPLPWHRMGPEPMNGDFTSEVLTERLHGRTAQIKPLLLNQQIVAGLGNIYVDEALHLAGIHPRRSADALTPDDVRRLRDAIQSVLLAAVERRGTTFSNYADIAGRAGRYQDELRVFRKVGAQCPRCRTPIVRLVVGGRGTHICPSCQKV